VKESSRQQLDDFGFRNTNANRSGKGDEFDHGKENIMLPDQERDQTLDKTYEGNLTSLVKSITAPLEDMLKGSRKEYLTEPSHLYGNMSTTFPKKSTIKDKKDVLRTTIRETTERNEWDGTLKGPTKLTTYDPEEVAKTTHRETMEVGERYGNMQGLEGGVGGYRTAEADPRQTQKEYLSDTDYFGGAGGKSDFKQSSFEQYYNADVNVLKEGTLKGRAPTYQSAKNATGADMVNQTTRKLTSDETARRNIHNRDINRGAPLDSDHVFVTKNRNTYNNDERLDDVVLSSLASNPYAIKSF
jgi:hypothetical protein